MSNPKVYGFCEAGCRYPVTPYEEFEKSASLIEAQVDDAGNCALDFGKTYKIYPKVDASGTRNATFRVKGIYRGAECSFDIFQHGATTKDPYIVIVAAEAFADYDFDNDGASSIFMPYKSKTRYKAEAEKTAVFAVDLDDYPAIVGDFVDTSLTVSNVEKVYAYNEEAEIVVYGKSAYEVALDNGFEGTEEEWLASLKGEKGDKGEITNLAATLEGNEEDKAPSVKAVKAGLDELGGRIARNDKRITNIEQGIPPELFETDSSVAYEKDIPEKALPYAEISKIGGMTYKDGSTLKSAKVTEIASVGVNLIDLKDMPIAGSNRFDIPITVTEGKYWLSIFNSDGTEDGWKRGYAYAARFMHDDENIVLTVDSGAVVTKEQAAKINKFRIFITPDNYTGTSSTFTAMLNKGETHAPLIPYFKRTIPIPEAVQALDGYGWGVNDSVYNYIDYEKKQFVKRVGVVDMGTLNWWYSSGIFQSDLSNLKYSRNGIIPNMLCSIYTTIGAKSSSDFGNVEDKSITVNYTMPRIYVKDAAYTDATAFKNAMSGVMLYYELAEPIVTDISDILPADNFIEVEGGGTITAVNENGFDVPSEITYMLEEETV